MEKVSLIDAETGADEVMSKIQKLKKRLRATAYNLSPLQLQLLSLSLSLSVSVSVCVSVFSPPPTPTPTPTLTPPPPPSRRRTGNLTPRFVPPQ